MKCGEWLRDLTPDEASWTKKCYDAMALKAKASGYNSHDPCSRLRPDRYDCSENNTEEQHLVGGPKRHLPPYWISFVNKHKKIPQLRPYYLAKVQAEARAKAADLGVDEKEVAVEPPVYCELSHVCGDKSCIKPTHIVCEKETDNLDRYKYCHTLIRQWVEDNKRNRLVQTRGLITAAAAGLVCGHDPQCFINVDEKRSGNRKRTLPRDIDEVERRNPRRAPKRQRVNDDMFGVKSSSSFAEDEFRRKRTVIYDGERGWIKEVDGDRIEICLYDGASRKTRSLWISKTSPHLTIPQR